ncbi:disulfide bond formation protein B [Caulobacter sp. NIBR1757]|uniref:disulfide bond formation protein B n=1 Tax=Caulobacter sp. NIBR1757 TaxID=3016000 RepID=UPI0022F110FF|nr:disulfide bond formation protein B [Caulobacter sp. NIBR1757]WGM39014.1 Disulfide bond formation protein B [Caulobacter sp. NIBR1757]
MQALKRLISFVLRHWPETALLSALLMLAIAHGFEAFLGLMPCTLCLKAREVYWVAAAVAVVAIVVRRTPWARRTAPWFDLALGLIFLFGAGLAFYHSGVEWKWWPGPTTCSGGGGGAGSSAAGVSDLLAGGHAKAPRCDEVLWSFLGLSMAGWNIVVSLKLAVWSFIAAANEPRTGLLK